MENIKKIISTRIKELRTRQNLTQERRSELTNLDQRIISSAECGHSLSFTTLEYIIRTLQFDISEFFEFNRTNKTDKEIINEIEKS